MGPATVASPITGPNGISALRSWSGGEDDLHHREALRDHHRPEQALHDAGGDQERDTGGQAAGERGERVPGHAEQEQSSATEQVT
jgi:hypothetical protein